MLASKLNVVLIVTLMETQGICENPLLAFALPLTQCIAMCEQGLKNEHACCEANGCARIEVRFVRYHVAHNHRTTIMLSKSTVNL